MRNTTKLKHILLKYSLSIDMDDEGLFTFSLVDKYHNHEMHTIEANSYSSGMSKAYSYLLKKTSTKLQVDGPIKQKKKNKSKT